MNNPPKFIVVFLVVTLFTCCLPATVEAASDLQVLEDNLAKITTYEYGQSRLPLTAVSDFIRDAQGVPRLQKRIEKQLIQFLQSDATLAGKQFICRQLRIIGTEQSASTLAPMLTDPATSDMARYALESISGAVVDNALRGALTKTSGKERIGIINTLGVRRDRKAVTILKNLIYDSDMNTAAAASAALGQIADSEAASALAKAVTKARDKLRPLVADAYLKCADQLLAQGKKNQALAIYKQLHGPDQSAPIRVAAFRGVVTVMGEEAVGIVIDTLKGDDQATQAAAVGLIREIPGTKTIKAVAAELPTLSTAQQVRVLSALGDRGDSVVLPAVVTAAKDQNESVRIAALKALGKLGNASTVDMLARTASTTTGGEKQAALESLYRLRGTRVNKKILSSIPNADTEMKVILIRSIGQRYAKEGVITILRTARDADNKVRLESLKTLRVIAGPRYYPELVSLLISAKNQAQRNAAEKAVVTVAHQIPDKNQRAVKLLIKLSAMGFKDITARCALLKALGKIEADNALPVLRMSLKHKNTRINDAAIRALSEWHNAEPAADLLEIVRTSRNRTHRVLALRGFIRLVGLDKGRPADETIKMYKQAMQLASNTNEKKMVLSGLANVESYPALQVAAAYLDDKDLQQEAEAAVVKIARSTFESHPQETRDVLKKVLRITENDSLRERLRRMMRSDR